jgi:transcriptional regulator with XRE-family HTH domain
MTSSATITAIKSKRIAAGISGRILCKKLGMARTRLSDLERGYVRATPKELTRIDTALDDLIRAQETLRRAAQEAGWPVSEAVV